MTKWCIKYIQEPYWDHGISTERGYETWLDCRGAIDYSADPSKAMTFLDINAAHATLSKLVNGSNWYYLVEEMS